MVLTKVPMIKDSTSEKVFKKFLMAEIMVNIPPLDRNVPLRVKIYLPVEGPYQLDHLLACDEIGPQCLFRYLHECILDEVISIPIDKNSQVDQGVTGTLMQFRKLKETTEIISDCLVL